MQVEVTIRGADGVERDVAVIAPRRTRVAAVLAAVQRTLPAAGIGWIDGRPVDETAEVGSSGLRRGAVLAAEPSQRDDTYRLRLDVIGGPSAGRSVALVPGITAIGRAAHCDLVLADPLVSRRHATVTMTGADVTVCDAGSTNGTRIDGERVDGESSLAPGATVRLGDSYLTLRAPGHDDASPHSPVTDRVVDWPADPPPAARHAQVAAALVPAVAGVALAAAMRSVEFLAFALLSPISLAATTLIERWRRRRRRRTARREIAHQRAAVESDIAAELQAEVRRRHAQHADPVTVLRSITSSTRRVQSLPRAGPARLEVRLGLGAMPSAVRIRTADTITPAAGLDDVPVTVDLGAGPWSIVGPLAAREAAARWVVGQVAARSSPTDLEIALLASSASPWHWMRWLPHVRGRVACTPAACTALAGDIAALVEQRRSTASASSCRLVVVVTDDRAERRLARELAGAADAGVTAVFLSNSDPAAVPRARTIRVSGETGTRARIGDGPELVLDLVAPDWAERLARRLAPAFDGHASGSTLPAQCRFAELVGLEPPTAAAVTARWRRSDGAMRACIGVDADGPVEIDFVHDGPHGLIAGTTGSGKSELLQTLIVSLATSYPPGELTFLLVDYKGGAALARFAELPHTAGLVTDLDEYLGRRVLTSLRSELRRRERLLAGVGAADLAGYRAAGRALPRLLLVVDELAALAESFSGLVPGLVEIAQRGRSLGVHLLLATQRPSGVVSPDIRANTSVSVALRTTSAAESIDVIDDAAAASIAPTTPGRAYLRAGARLRAVQCACVSAPAPGAAVRVELLDDWLRPRRRDVDARGTDLDCLLSAVRTAGGGQPPARRPWLPPLPARVAAGQLPDIGEGLLVPIGLADLPDEQRRAAAGVDLGIGGAVVFTGGPRSGRSCALISLALAAAERHRCDALEIHAVGSAAASGVLRALPHVGTLATLSDGGRLAARLIERLVVDGNGGSGSADRPRSLVLVDDWEALGEAAEQLDGGRTVDRILALARDGPVAGRTVAIAGGRTTLATRVTACAHTRFVLRLTERSDYPAAGIAPSDVPLTMPPGRALRAGDTVEAQLCDPSEHMARAAACRERSPTPRRRTVLRPLPSRVLLRDLPRVPGWVLGAGGDAAATIGVDLRAGRGRLLVAGPPGSGRSTVLRLLLAQSATATTWVAAPGDSPVAAAARDRSVRLVSPDDPADAAPPPDAVLLVDDAEAFLDTAIGDALTQWVRTSGPTGVAVVAACSDALAVSSRGLGAEARRSRCGLLLQPGPLDAELLAARLPRLQPSELPGRGVLVPDPGWQLGREPIPIQVALSEPVSPCADSRDRSPERRSP